MSIRCEAVLFDLDGTLLDSSGAVERSWRAWCARNDIPSGPVLHLLHGRRSVETIAAVAPELDAVAEDAVLQRLEASDVEGVVALPGALELLGQLPRDSWAIVTSGVAIVACARMKAAAISAPDVVVFGDQVARGKPAPDPFLFAARRLNVDPGRCVVFEDSPFGFAAARAAGMTVVAVGAGAAVAPAWARSVGSQRIACIGDYREVRLDPTSRPRDLRLELPTSALC